MEQKNKSQIQIMKVGIFSQRDGKILNGLEKPMAFDLPKFIS